MRKLICSLFILLCIPSSIIADNWIDSGNYSISWYSSGSTEYTINSSKEFAGLAYLVNIMGVTFQGKTININSDIDLYGHNWVPIGYETCSFQGSLVGNDHLISNISITNTSAGPKCEWGLFGLIYQASISSLNLSGQVIITETTNLYTDYVVGGLSAFASHSRIQSCNTNMNVVYTRTKTNSFSYKTRVGGLVGHALNSEISFCKTKGNVKYEITGSPLYSSSNEGYIGGIVGYGPAYIECCENYADIDYINKSSTNSYTYTIYAGGIIGYLSTSLAERIIKYSMNAGKISVNAGSRNVEYLYLGCIAGMSYSEIIGCYTYTGGCYSVGGIPTISGIAYMKNYSISGCYTHSDIYHSASNTSKSGSKGSTLFSSTQMKSDDFLNTLNIYSDTQMQRAIWDKGSDGYPHVNYEKYNGIYSSLEKCISPTIRYENGKVYAVSSTENSICHLTAVIDYKIEGKNEMEITPVLKISAYASAENYNNSDVSYKEFEMELSRQTGDLNNDGKITMDDVNKLVNIYLKQ